jgi:D-aspartate ligase
MRPAACVLGDGDLVRALGLAGIRSVLVAPADEPARFSRFVVGVVPWADHWTEAETLVERLIAFGRAQPQPPILFFQSDGDLALVSRHRARLGEQFRFVIASEELVESVLDKGRFQTLAESKGLPVPRARRLRASTAAPPVLDLQFPVLVKPVTRVFATWAQVDRHGKAVAMESPDELRALWPRLAATGIELLAQELVEGPESAIESYHVYVDEQGEIAADFTGKKGRTYPPAFGQSTALVTTEARDVAELGRHAVRALGLRGVAKLDFKRDCRNRLWLLEVNPRFNLWHHLGAKAGVNLAAFVYADLAGEPRPEAGPARPGIRWTSPWLDVKAARAAGVPGRNWVPSILLAHAKSGFAIDDPRPFLRGLVWPRLAGRRAHG